MAVGFLPSAILVGGVLGTQLWLLELPFVAWELPVLGLLAALPVLAVAVGLYLPFELTAAILLGGLLGRGLGTKIISNGISALGV